MNIKINKKKSITLGFSQGIVIIRFILKLLLLIILIALREGLGSEFLSSIVEQSRIMKPLLGFLIFLTSVNLIIRSCQFIYRKRKKYGHKYSDNVIIGLQNIYYILNAVGVVFMILGFFGLEPKVLLTSISIVAAAIAIISKEQVTDIICGINISFSKELAIGDYVRVGEQRGTVIDINIHKIVLRNDYDDIIFISNTKAYYSDIVNYNQKEIKNYSLDFSVSGSTRLSKIELQKQLLIIIDKFDSNVEPEVSMLKIMSIEKDEVKYRYQFKLKQFNPALAQDIKAALLEEIQIIIQARLV